METNFNHLSSNLIYNCIACNTQFNPNKRTVTYNGIQDPYQTELCPMCQERIRNINHSTLDEAIKFTNNLAFYTEKIKEMVNWYEEMKQKLS